MRFRTLWGPLAATALVATLLAPSAVAQISLERVVVVLRDGTGRPAAVADDLVSRSGGSVSQVWRDALKGFAAEIPAAAVDALRNDPRVESVEPDSIVTAFGELPTGVDRIEDDKKIPMATSNLDYSTAANPSNKVGVAVIDTGIAVHPDLNVVSRVDCTGLSGCVAGGSDGNGHGTHVAGTIGAKDDGVGVVGVIPGVDLYAVRVLDNRGSGQLSWLLAGLDWVVQNKARITTANLSLGFSGIVSSADTAVRNTVAAGVTVVIAAGNSGVDASGTSPARVTEAITVSALADGDGQAGGAGAITCRSGEVDDTLASFSNFGSVVDIAAPGVCIRSTWLKGGFNTISGTSMASPHVAGAAALYRFLNPSATPSQIQSALTSAWSVAQTDACGYGPNAKGRVAGPLLMLAVCDIAAGGGGATTTPPGDFSKTSPANGGTAITKGGGVAFSWATSSGATSYALCVRVGSSGTPSCFPATGTSLRVSGFTKGVVYQWQVTAQNGIGTTTANGGTWWGFTPA